MADMTTGTKPITLVTATPGGGKTAMVVSLIEQAVAAGRPVFQQGIPELKLDHGPVPPIPEWTQLRNDPDTGLDLPYFTFPPNSLVVLDEAQRIYRTRPAGAKVPDHVAAFETVRHTGVTFILITQSPTFLDSHIRKLVGQHIHLRDVGVLGRWYYEWPECEDHPDKSFNSAPIKKKWTLPKRVFGLYKSSSLHIKRKYTLPPSVIILAACLLVAFGIGWRVYGRVSSVTKAQEVVQQNKQPGQTVPAAADPHQSAGDILAAAIPAVPGRPETAPMYAALRVVKVMPRVDGCLATKSECLCYTQQGTNAGLDDAQCRAWIANPPFDPYRDVQAVSADPRRAQSAPSSASPLLNQG